MINDILSFIIFPGFLFTAAAGMLASWIDRKVTAAVQWRQGPPLLQPFYDVLKLMTKEIVLPAGVSKWTFLLSPLIGLAAITLVSTMIWKSIISPSNTFSGDLIVIIYLMMLPPIMVILGGIASRNPLASLGVSREMKLLMAYELPFIIAVFIPVMKSGFNIQLGGLLNYQLSNGMFIHHPSCIIALIVAILCMQAKLSLVPFDIPEAETEIMAGPYIEYSGAPLAVYKLTKMMMLFVVPVFLIVIFMGGVKSGGGWNALTGILKYVFLLVIVVLIRNTNPRVRIDQAIRFFWGPVTLLAVFGVYLAFLGA